MIKAIYTDGACSKNPGPGGWGTVIYFQDGSVHELGGGAAQTTNNRMELQAAIAGLEFYKAHGNNAVIDLFTDSQYVQKGATDWIFGWQRKNWVSSTGKPVLNQDLWTQIAALNSGRINWQWVRGHSGNVGNERCDVIAVAYARSQPITLQQLAHYVSG